MKAVSFSQKNKHSQKIQAWQARRSLRHDRSQFCSFSTIPPLSLLSHHTAASCSGKGLWCVSPPRFLGRSMFPFRSPPKTGSRQHSHTQTRKSPAASPRPRAGPNHLDIIVDTHQAVARILSS